ncbi:hypothetical protein BP6252_11303 [Coleophoma cylindrospora]|uniref:Amino acid transporter transmembrane domain-containing protein n=1 Tax=Coleophoma cylindrospora TaxID=1849047 RepID=A0A3D8QQ03_9HELO|nr:hypothetical protein BP6252_11303 [Coleophoma cylindrospora]
MKSSSEKVPEITEYPPSEGVGEVDEIKLGNEHEVFKKGEDIVDFRTVGWLRASSICIKIQFALGVLNIPSCLYTLGAFPGALCVVGWAFLNTYNAVLFGDFKFRHPGIYDVTDVAYVIGGPILREVMGALFMIGCVFCVASSCVGLSTAFNALSHHAACTVWWSFLSMFFIGAGASMRKFHSIGWLTWAGFASMFVSVFIVVVAVTQLDRPAAAPPTGPYDLGWNWIGYPTFISAMTASTSIFVSGAGAPMFLQVISEMRKPTDFRKALYLCNFIINASYLAFSLVIYRWCGKWVASPSLGSAGQTIKMVAYGIALLGLFVGAILYLHLGAKMLFVRVLRNSRHLQANTVVHWSVWLSCTFGLCALGFILAEAIPIFNYLIALTGSICFAPLSLALPPVAWLYDHWDYRKGSLLRKGIWSMFVLSFLLGTFMTVGGTYSTVELIIEAYASGQIGSAFSCADNSNSS